MYDQRLSNRENHRQLEGVSAPPAINIRAHRNKGNMPFMETESDRIIDERLAKKFGAKDHYEDWEVEEAFEELHAENALPDLSHFD